MTHSPHHSPDPKDFWARLEDVQAGMLKIGTSRPVPMSHYIDKDANSLWFISAKGSAAVQAVGAGPTDAEYQIASSNGQIYAHIEGKAELSNDKAKLDELWNAVADSWFEDGKRDEDVQLIRVDLTEAEVWLTPGKIGFLYEVSKAQITDDKPDMGEHGRLSFVA